MRRSRWVPGPRGRAGALAALLLGGSGAVAQAPGAAGPGTLPPSDPPRWGLGLAGSLAVPTGAFGRTVGLGGGVAAHGALYLDRGRHVALRFDMSWTIYGKETVRVPLGPAFPSLAVDVTTENGFGTFTLGPELVLGTGRVRPWLRAAAGISDFSTSSYVASDDGDDPLDATTEFSDATRALVLGGGIQILLATVPHPVSLDLGTVHLWHGEHEYLRDEGAAGRPALQPLRGRTSAFLIQLGLRVGVG